jgi:hypothetical protein
MHRSYAMRQCRDLACSGAGIDRGMSLHLCTSAQVHQHYSSKADDRTWPQTPMHRTRMSNENASNILFTSLIKTRRALRFPRNEALATGAPAQMMMPKLSSLDFASKSRFVGAGTKRYSIIVTGYWKHPGSKRSVEPQLSSMIFAAGPFLIAGASGSDRQPILSLPKAARAASV